jgi:hypothetical protein
MASDTATHPMYGSKCRRASRPLMLASLLSSLTLADLSASKAQESSGLEIQLIVTAEGRELFESWDNSGGKPFQVVPVTITPRGRFLSAVVLFRGCKADPSGNCNVELDIVAYDPTGKVYGEIGGAELWHGPGDRASGCRGRLSGRGLGARSKCRRRDQVRDPVRGRIATRNARGDRRRARNVGLAITLTPITFSAPLPWPGRPSGAPPRTLEKST